VGRPGNRQCVPRGNTDTTSITASDGRSGSTGGGGGGGGGEEMVVQE